jgi:hypothetical protein
MAEFARFEELSAKWVDDPIVGVLIVKQWAPEQGICTIPSDA